MPNGEYEVFEALDPFFEVVMEGLRGLADGDHYFDTNKCRLIATIKYRWRMVYIRRILSHAEYDEKQWQK